MGGGLDPRVTVWELYRLPSPSSTLCLLRVARDLKEREEAVAAAEMLLGQRRWGYICDLPVQWL